MTQEGSCRQWLAKGWSAGQLASKGREDQADRCCGHPGQKKTGRRDVTGGGSREAARDLGLSPCPATLCSDAHLKGERILHAGPM